MKKASLKNIGFDIHGILKNKYRIVFSILSDERVSASVDVLFCYIQKRKGGTDNEQIHSTCKKTKKDRRRKAC